MTPDQFRYRYDHFFKMLNKHLDGKRAEYLKAHPRARDATLSQFDLPARLSPHKCRHTYARRLLAATGDLKTVQAQLGHQQVSTTEIYLDDEIEVRKNNVTKLKY
jgi:Site-specific recombinase XerC